MAYKSFKRERANATRIALARQTVSDEVFSRLGVTRGYVEQIEARFQGHIELPGMPGYDADRQGNPLYPACPKLIAYCASAQDIALALQMAREHGWAGMTTCRSGGHSTAGFSVNDGMVIDVSLMDDVVIDPDSNRMTVGSGANWGRINAKLDLYQKHVPGGGCPEVGVAGYMQGGGYGFTSREYGMNSDSVVEATVMLADGSIVVANPKRNAPLFWAIRGGTGNQFGVLLEIKYRLNDLYELWGFGIEWSLSDAAAALDEMQTHYMKTGAPAALGYQTVFATVQPTDTPRKVVVMLGMFHGTRQDGLRALESLLATPGAKLVEDVIGTYAQLNASLLNILTQPKDGLFELKRSGYIGRPLGLAGWQAVVDAFATTPNQFNLVGLEIYGGAINAYPPQESAFIHRDVYMDFFVDSFFDPTGTIVPTTQDQAGRWLATVMKSAEPCMNGHVYQDYPERDLPNYRWAYWGDAFPSLLQVKQAYDPTSFFRYGQSISEYPDEPHIKRSNAPGRFANVTIEYEAYSRGA
jgi:FAD/FMN-containing dehydrogenase